MLPGVAVNVIHRGNNRAPCFFKDEDRSFYLFHMRRLLPRADCHLHAYWEGRFKSGPVQSQDYVLACYRYTELNPIRAGLVRRPDEYVWSSHAANAKGEVSSLVTPHGEYLGLGRSPIERQAVYRELFGSLLRVEQLEEIRTATNAGYPLGSTAFKRTVSRALGRPVEKGSAGRPPRKSATEDQLDLL
jgi:putative transposase